MISPKISIIVPVYKVPLYLNQCIQSILGQTYQDIEVILIDDGSPDNCGAVCDQYAAIDSRLKVIHQENAGTSQARNTGLEIATGKYILFVDGDDWIDLNTCYESIQLAEATGADVVFWSYMREYPDKSLPRKVCLTENHSFDKQKCFELRRRLVGPLGNELAHPENLDNFSTIWGKLYRRDCIQNVRFVDLKKIGTSEDTLFNIQVFVNVRHAEYLDKYFYHYRKDNVTSCTTTYKADLLDQWTNLYSMIQTEIAGNERLSQALNNRIALNLISLGLNAISSTEPFRSQCKEIKKVLNNSRYKASLVTLDIRPMPIHWTVFFLFAKLKFASGIIILCHIASRLKSKF